MGVNALNGLLLISSGKLIWYKGRAFYCVNALNGLLLISSEIDELLVNSKSSCQCPQRASTYFFHFHEILWIPFLGVSMPSTGFYLFLQDPFYPKDDIRWCVNALNGLLLISSNIIAGL